MGNEVPFIVYIPVILCLLAAILLLHYRGRSNGDILLASRDYEGHSSGVNIGEAGDSLRRRVSDDEADSSEGSSDDAGEGTSSRPTRKLGKKKAEKLKRKEQRRAYREYINQQIEQRRLQEELLEDEYQRKHAEDLARRAYEQEQIKRRRAKQAAQEEAIRIKREQEQQKRAQKFHALYKKLSAKIMEYIMVGRSHWTFGSEANSIAAGEQKNRFIQVQDVADDYGISNEDAEAILERLKEQDPRLNDAIFTQQHPRQFIYLTDNDYTSIAQLIKDRGQMSAEQLRGPGGIVSVIK
ncbi:hypothetical protein BZG36_02398 [Bifiguratus adelaidae]|uniref:DDRGK domain-containing protein 1 n=1 Tax=Bifiguratus adelaidae TaxID=1938954 RepID=A0A261Y1D0_9FUNG|nr:hypothetical protein BZG36_02398 [Bifiguratus adelaidae]